MPPVEEIRTAYATLGLLPGASLAEVGRAYRRLARALHPDLHPGRPGHGMARVNRAYAALKNHLAAAAVDGGHAFPEFVPSAAPRRPARPTPPGPPARKPVSRAETVPQTGSLSGEAPVLAAAGTPAPFVRPRGEAAGWRLLGVEKRGGRLAYRVELRGEPARLELPLRRRKPCPACAGEGVSARGFCPACGGTGWLVTPARLVVELPAGWRPGEVLALADPAGGEVLVELARAAGKGAA